MPEQYVTWRGDSDIRIDDIHTSYTEGIPTFVKIIFQHPKKLVNAMKGIGLYEIDGVLPKEQAKNIRSAVEMIVGYHFDLKLQKFTNKYTEAEYNKKFGYDFVFFAKNNSPTMDAKYWNKVLRI